MKAPLLAEALYKGETNLIIDAPGGRYSDGMSGDDYRKTGGVNFSTLKHAPRSAAHYKASLFAPRKATKDMKLGTMIHMAVLQPELFAVRYHRKPCSLATKEGKRWKAALPEGAEILSQVDADIIAGVKAAVMSHKLARPCLTGGVAERSFWWTDPKTGILCKCRCDYITGGKVVDLKSTKDAQENPFERDSWNRDYQTQGAFYLDGVTETIGKPHAPHIIIAVEKAPPFGVQAYYMGSLLYEIGQANYREALDTIKECREAQAWPGYPEVFKELCPPPWAK